MQRFVRNPAFDSRHVIMLAMVLLFSLSLFSGAVSAQEGANEEMPVQQVDINTADADLLALALDGVGAARAEAIVAYREEHGRFEEVDDLEEVTGIGPATMERNRERLRVGGAGE